LWKITSFDLLSDACAKYYSPAEHLAVNEVIVLCKGRVILKHYIPKKHKKFGIKICKLCDSKRYMYNISVNLGKGQKHATATKTATHASVTGLATRIENLYSTMFLNL
jgi:hypothetical protein